MIMRKEFDDMTVQEKYLKIADDVIAAALTNRIGIRWLPMRHQNGFEMRNLAFLFIWGIFSVPLLIMNGIP